MPTTPSTQLSCGLCHERGAEQRPGRLGRYAVTCAACEARRGSHLKRNGSGYMNKTSSVTIWKPGFAGTHVPGS